MLTAIMPPVYAQAVFNLPKPGEMIGLSEAFAPVVLKGVSIHPEDPLLFDFIVDNGHTALAGQALTDETTKLVKYFLAGLAVPEKDLWVNLSPVEKDRIMADDLSHTDVGRDMLAQDYVLKQITSTLMYPEKDLGRQFWAEVYKRTYDKFGNTDVPVDSFNKVWITPDEATVYQNGNNAFVAGSHLKVMLESDYQAQAALPTGGHGAPQSDLNERGSVSPSRLPTSQPLNVKATEGDDHLTTIAKDVVREVILPVLEKEVNEGRNFAALRQVFQSMILAGWYKKALKESLLNQVYANTNKVEGIDIPEKDAKELVYAQYMEAFRTGVYNYVKEEYDQNTQEIMPRKYFSGGIQGLLNVTTETPGNASTKTVENAQSIKGDASQITFKFSVKQAFSSLAKAFTRRGAIEPVQEPVPEKEAETNISKDPVYTVEEVRRVVNFLKIRFEFVLKGIKDRKPFFANIEAYKGEDGWVTAKAKAEDYGTFITERYHSTRAEDFVLRRLLFSTGLNAMIMFDNMHPESTFTRDLVIRFDRFDFRIPFETAPEEWEQVTINVLNRIAKVQDWLDHEDEPAIRGFIDESRIDYSEQTQPDAQSGKSLGSWLRSRYQLALKALSDPRMSKLRSFQKAISSLAWGAIEGSRGYVTYVPNTGAVTYAGKDLFYLNTFTGDFGITNTAFIETDKGNEKPFLIRSIDSLEAYPKAWKGKHNLVLQSINGGLLSIKPIGDDFDISAFSGKPEDLDDPAKYQPLWLDKAENVSIAAPEILEFRDFYKQHSGLLYQDISSFSFLSLAKNGVLVIQRESDREDIGSWTVRLTEDGLLNFYNGRDLMLKAKVDPQSYINFLDNGHAAWATIKIQLLKAIKEIDLAEANAKAPAFTSEKVREKFTADYLDKFWLSAKDSRANNMGHVDTFTYTHKVNKQQLILTKLVDIEQTKTVVSLKVNGQLVARMNVYGNFGLKADPLKELIYPSPELTVKTRHLASVIPVVNDRSPDDGTWVRFEGNSYRAQFLPKALDLVKESMEALQASVQEDTSWKNSGLLYGALKIKANDLSFSERENVRLLIQMASNRPFIETVWEDEYTFSVALIGVMSEEEWRSRWKKLADDVLKNVEKIRWRLALRDKRMAQEIVDQEGVQVINPKLYEPDETIDQAEMAFAVVEAMDLITAEIEEAYAEGLAVDHVAGRIEAMHVFSRVSGADMVSPWLDELERAQVDPKLMKRAAEIIVSRAVSFDDVMKNKEEYGDLTLRQGYVRDVLKQVLAETPQPMPVVEDSLLGLGLKSHEVEKLIAILRDNFSGTTKDEGVVRAAVVLFVEDISLLRKNSRISAQKELLGVLRELLSVSVWPEEMRGLPLVDMVRMAKDHVEELQISESDPGVVSLRIGIMPEGDVSAHAKGMLRGSGLNEQLSAAVFAFLVQAFEDYPEQVRDALVFVVSRQVAAEYASLQGQLSLNNKYYFLGGIGLAALSAFAWLARTAYDPELLEWLGPATLPVQYGAPLIQYGAAILGAGAVVFSIVGYGKVKALEAWNRFALRRSLQRDIMNSTKDTAALRGGIDLGQGDYLKVIATDTTGMPTFDPAQIRRLQTDLRGIIPVPAGLPQPVNVRSLLGLNDASDHMERAALL